MIFGEYYYAVYGSASSTAVKKENNTNLPINVLSPKWKDALESSFSFTSKHVPV